MTNDNMYGFTSTDEVAFDKQGLPIGEYKALIRSEEPHDKGVIAEFEALSGPDKGRAGKVWFLTKHENPQTANIAKQNIKRIAEATGRAVSAAAPLKGRVLTIQVRAQKKDDRYTEIAKYLPENHVSLDAPF